MTKPTTTISGTYCWAPGRGVLATLTETSADVGYSRMEVTGTEDDFRAAIIAASGKRSEATGSHKAALTCLIKRLEAAIR